MRASDGSGWSLGSDGNWYAPEPQPEESSGGNQHTAGEFAAYSPAAATASPVPWHGLNWRPSLVTIVAVIVVLVAAITVALII